jgi:hypothetical protein
MTGFTADQAARANQALRAALGMRPQLFSEEQFVGMISEEITLLRAAGRSDAEIATVLKEDAGVEIEPQTLSRFYVDDTHHAKSTSD